MSASRDWDTPFHFYYGNAAKDLAHVIPAGDEIIQESYLLTEIEKTQKTLNEIIDSYKELNYLVKDIKRSLK